MSEDTFVLLQVFTTKQLSLNPTSSTLSSEMQPISGIFMFRKSYHLYISSFFL